MFVSQGKKFTQIHYLIDLIKKNVLFLNQLVTVPQVNYRVGIVAKFCFSIINFADEKSHWNGE